jgi:hypothetical protein
VPAVTRGIMRVNRVDRDASGHRDRRDGCHHLMGCNGARILKELPMEKGCQISWGEKRRLTD